MLANPAIIYTLVWTLALLLYSLHYSNLFLELSDITLWYILTSIFSVLFAWIFIGVATKRFFMSFPRYIRPLETIEISKIRLLIKILVIGILIEMLYFHDVPILTFFGYSTMTYQDFGLPSLHGFLSAILLSLSMYSLYHYLYNNEKKYLYFYIATILVLLMSMSRGGITSLLIESFFLILVFKKFRLASMIKIGVLVLLFIYLFGLFGEFRSAGAGDSIYDVFQISDDYPVWLPKSFIWVYMYLTSSINNLENSLSSYSDLNFEPYLAMFGLLPTVIRIYFEPPEGIALVNEAFNVSSFMPNYLAAFGIYGSLIFYFFASMIAIWIYYRYVISYDLRLGFTLVIILHSVALSIFSDFFAIQVYLFQVILQFWIFNSFSSIKNSQTGQTYVQQ